MSSQRSSSRSIQGSQRSSNAKNNNVSKKSNNKNTINRKHKPLNTVHVAAQRHLHARRASSVSSTTSSKRGSQSTSSNRSSSSSSKTKKKTETQAQRNAKLKRAGNKQITKSRVTRRRSDLHAQEAPSWSTAIIERANENKSVTNKKNRKKDKTKTANATPKQQKSKTTKQTTNNRSKIDNKKNNKKKKKNGKALTKEMLTCELCKLRKDEWEFCGLTGNRHVIDSTDDDTVNEPAAKEEHKEIHTQLKQEVMM